MIDFYGKKLNTYKANLHTHTTTSDGSFSPDEVMKLYSEHGYDIMCTSDHRVVNDMTSFDHHGMLVLCGVEMHPRGGRIDLAHLLSIGVPQDFNTKIGLAEVEDFSAMQEVIDAVNAAGGLCYLAHPYWCGFRSDEIARLKGLAGIEVFNTSCRYLGKEYNMQTWDELCDMGLLYPALAVDDIHTQNELFGGWTVICCKERTEEAVMNALRKGEFYTSQGPEIKRISYENGIFEAEFSPVISAVLYSNTYNGWYSLLPGTDCKATGTTTSLRIDCSEIFRRSKDNVYMRLQIFDSDRRYAWTNPIPLMP